MDAFITTFINKLLSFPADKLIVTACDDEFSGYEVAYRENDINVFSFFIYHYTDSYKVEITYYKGTFRNTYSLTKEEYSSIVDKIKAVRAINSDYMMNKIIQELDARLS